VRILEPELGWVDLATAQASFHVRHRHGQTEVERARCRYLVQLAERVGQHAHKLVRVAQSVLVGAVGPSQRTKQHPLHALIVPSIDQRRDRELAGRPHQSWRSSATPAATPTAETFRYTLVDGDPAVSILQHRDGC
jgi:hypothetical protein